MISVDGVPAVAVSSRVGYRLRRASDGAEIEVPVHVGQSLSPIEAMNSARALEIAACVVRVNDYVNGISTLPKMGRYAVVSKSTKTRYGRFYRLRSRAEIDCRRANKENPGAHFLVVEI